MAALKGKANQSPYDNGLILPFYCIIIFFICQEIGGIFMPIYKMQGRKDGKQKYRVRLNYVDNLGKPKQIDRVAYGFDEAKQLERELNYQIKQETPTAKMTVQALYDEYIEAKKNEIRETTLDKIKKNLKNYVLEPLGNVRIDKLNAPILQKWKNNVEQQDLSFRTRQNRYSEFRALLNYAVKMEYLTQNPLLKVGNFKAPLQPKKEMQYYTAEEFKKYIKEARDIATQSEKQGSMYKWHYYVFFNIAFYTGLRKGEINALQWTDIKDGYLSVTKSLAQKLKGGDLITPPKNRSSIRTIQMPKPLIKILDEHYKRCQTMDGFNDNYFICGGTKCLRDTGIQNANKNYAGQAGLKVIRIHDFRHSHASLLANEGINIQEIARRLGHSEISMTWQTYSHLYPREEERAIAILNKIV